MQLMAGTEYETVVILVLLVKNMIQESLFDIRYSIPG